MYRAVTVSSFGPPVQTKLMTNWRGEGGGAAEMLRELAHMAYEERLKDLDFFFFFFFLEKPKGGSNCSLPLPKGWL